MPNHDMSGPTYDIEVVADLEYAHRDGVRLALDLYLPKDPPGPVPGVVYLHGGGFALGRRTDFPERLAGLARRGVAVASASYRLTHEAVFPAQLHDARAAVRWLRKNGARHAIDSARVGIWGASAGGTLALLAAFADGELAADEDDAVQAVVSWFGGSDLSPDATRALADNGAEFPSVLVEQAHRDGVQLPPIPSFFARLVGVDDERDAAGLLGAVSPLTYACRPGPPVLLMHGDRDGVAPIEQSRWMYDAVRAAGGDASMLAVAGANHEDVAFHEPEVLGAVASYLTAKLAAPAALGDGGQR